MIKDWEQLYSLQDWVLARLKTVEHGFYLSWGTGLSRGYYQHRYSEDLDFFLNDSSDFQLWRDRCLDSLERGAAAQGQRLEITLREERFGRAYLHGPVPLKLEFINDVPFRVGQPWTHPSLGPLDTKENILANKISALIDRQEPKDIADVFWLCCRDNLDLKSAIENAGGKAAGIFPPLVARSLSEALRLGQPKVAWRQAPTETEFRNSIVALVDKIIG
jgi:predicted nucleotidyltransferase component of viral defense system